MYFVAYIIIIINIVINIIVIIITIHLCTKVGIRAMLTFAFYKGGNELKRITGWQPSIINDMVTQSMTDYYLK